MSDDDETQSGGKDDDAVHRDEQKKKEENDGYEDNVQKRDNHYDDDDGQQDTYDGDNHADDWNADLASIGLGRDSFDVMINAVAVGPVLKYMAERGELDGLPETTEDRPSDD